VGTFSFNPFTDMVYCWPSEEVMREAKKMLDTSMIDTNLFSEEQSSSDPASRVEQGQSHWHMSDSKTTLRSSVIGISYKTIKSKVKMLGYFEQIY